MFVHVRFCGNLSEISAVIDYVRRTCPMVEVVPSNLPMPIMWVGDRMEDRIVGKDAICEKIAEALESKLDRAVQLYKFLDQHYNSELV